MAKSEKVKYDVYIAEDGERYSIRGLNADSIKKVVQEIENDFREKDLDHLCWDCSNLFDCPKFFDAPTKLLNDDNYEFIETGIQYVQSDYNSVSYRDEENYVLRDKFNEAKMKKLFVGKCTNFKHEKKKR